MAGLSCEGLVDVNAEWMNDAACRGVDTEVFFRERGEHLGEARAVCARCPVQDECLDYAVTNGISHGLWFKSARERRRMKPLRERVLSQTARQRMVWLSEHGWTSHEIAREFSVTARTVARHIAMERAS